METQRKEAEEAFNRLGEGSPPVEESIRERIIEKHMEFLSLRDAVLSGQSVGDMFGKYREYLTIRSELLGPDCKK